MALTLRRPPGHEASHSEFSPTKRNESMNCPLLCPVARRGRLVETRKPVRFQEFGKFPNITLVKFGSATSHLKLYLYRYERLTASLKLAFGFFPQPPGRLPLKPLRIDMRTYVSGKEGREGAVMFKVSANAILPGAFARKLWPITLFSRNPL